MNNKDIFKLKELLVSSSSNQSIQNKYTKLFASTDDYLVMKVAEIGAELYSHTYKNHYSSEKIKIADLPLFWNNRTLEEAKVFFKENYIKTILERNFKDMEFKYVNEICDKYGLSKYPTYKI